jgi:hypothetical protein
MSQQVESGVAYPGVLMESCALAEAVTHSIQKVPLQVCHAGSCQ